MNGALSSCNAEPAAANVLVRYPLGKANQRTQLENIVRTVLTTQDLAWHAAYAGHRAQSPVYGITMIESLAGLVNEMQITAAALNMIQRTKRLVLGIKGMAAMKAQLHRVQEIWRAAAADTARLGPQLSIESAIAAELALLDLSDFYWMFLTTTPAHTSSGLPGLARLRRRAGRLVSAAGVARRR